MLTLIAVLLAHEWTAHDDGTPKTEDEGGAEPGTLVYYLRGVGWKVRHPVTALCSVDGVTRPWLAALNRHLQRLRGRRHAAG
jgi:hypothetical protein